MSKSETIYKKGKKIHRKQKHDGPYATCDEWVCLSYKARARQVATERGRR